MWYGPGLAFYTKEEIRANSQKEKTYGACEGERSQIREFLLMPKLPGHVRSDSIGVNTSPTFEY